MILKNRADYSKSVIALVVLIFALVFAITYILITKFFPFTESVTTYYGEKENLEIPIFQFEEPLVGHRNLILFRNQVLRNTGFIGTGFETNLFRSNSLAEGLKWREQGIEIYGSPKEAPEFNHILANPLLWVAPVPFSKSTPEFYKQVKVSKITYSPENKHSSAIVKIENDALPEGDELIDQESARDIPELEVALMTFNAIDAGMNWMYISNSQEEVIELNFKSTEALKIIAGFTHMSRFCLDKISECNGLPFYAPYLSAKIKKAPSSIQLHFWKDKPDNISQEPNWKYDLVFQLVSKAKESSELKLP